MNDFPNQDMIQNMVMQTVNMFNGIKQQHMKADEVYILNVNADNLFHNATDPEIDVNAVTDKICSDLTVKLHSPKNSDLRALMILNETKDVKNLNVSLMANVGVSKGMGLFQFNYANMSLQNPMQLLLTSNQHVKLNEKLDLKLKPKDLILVLVGDVNTTDDSEETIIRLRFNKKDNGYDLILAIVAVIILLLIIYLLLKNDEREVGSELSKFYFY